MMDPTHFWRRRCLGQLARAVMVLIASAAIFHLRAASARTLPSFTAPATPPLPVPRSKAPVSAPLPTVAPVSPPAPAAAPAGPVAAGQPPTTAPDCLSALKSSNVSVERTDIGPQPDARCTVVDAVKLVSLRIADGSNVAFPDKPTVACTTATTFAAFVRELVVPLAKGSYGSPVDAVWTGPGLDCRTRDHIVGAKLSAHALGLAVDIAQVRLANGRTLEVGRPKTDVDRAFETAARAGGCGYFHTVLGPGADAFHETHWHFDLLPRGSNGDAKFCQ